MKLRRCDQLLAQIGRSIDQKPVISIGADRNRRLGTLEFGVLGSSGEANRTSAIPLRNPATCRGAQDDDPKHDPSPGDSNAFRPKASKVDTGMVTLFRSGTCHAWRSTLKREAVAAAYLRAAQAYILISMPTGTSTIFGVFQAILALLLIRTNFALALT